MFREFLGSLFGRRSASVEEVVFERVDDSGLPVDTPQSVGRSVPVEKILKRVPAAWKREGEPPLHEVLVLPEEAILPGTNTAETRYSLRYLARFYPSMFRDPGVLEADPGVSISVVDQSDPVQGLFNPEAGRTALPSDAFLEVALDPATFSVWEDDRVTPAARQQEAQETRRVLSKVRLPASSVAPAGGFEASLAQSSSLQERASDAVSDQEPATSQTPALAPPPKAEVTGHPAASALAGVAAPQAVRPVSGSANLRLRRILAAYAETLPEATAAAETTPSQPMPPLSAPVSRATAPLADSGVVEPARIHTRPAASPGIEAEAAWPARVTALATAMAGFPEVGGFAFWEGLRMVHRGRLGFDPNTPGVSAYLESFLAMSSRFGIPKGHESSLVFQSQRGGFAVFGSEKSLLFVALNASTDVSGGLRVWVGKWLT